MLPRALFGWFALWAVCLASLDATRLTAQEPPPAARIARLVQQLGDRSYRNRREASELLAGMGLAARQALQAAVESNDPELRLRARQLLDRIRLLEIWSSTPLPLNAQYASTSEALRDLAERSQNQLRLGTSGSALREKPIQLAQQPLCFWEWIETIGRQTGNRLHPSPINQPGLVLVEGPWPNHPAAHAGPFRLELQSLEMPKGETPGPAVDLQLRVEPRCTLVAFWHQPQLRSVQVEGQDAAIFPVQSSPWRVHVGKSLIDRRLALPPGVLPPRGRATLKFTWGCMLVSEFRHLELPRVAAGVQAAQDDLQVLVESIEPAAGGSTVVVLHALRHQVEIDPPDAIGQELSLKVLRADGTPAEVTHQDHQLLPNGLKATLHIANLPPATPPRIQVRYPRVRSYKEVEFVLRDVDLESLSSGTQPQR